MNLVIEYLPVVPPLVLGQIHGGIRVAQQIFGRYRVPNAEGDTDTGRDVKGLTPDPEAIAQFLDHPLGHGGQLGVVVDLFAEDDEFVTAKPCQCVARPHDADQSFARLNQQLVTDVMAMAIVDQFETIEIDEQQPHQFGRSLAAAQGIGYPVANQSPVRQVRQGIVRRLPSQFLLDLLAFRDILEGRDQDPAILAMNFGNRRLRRKFGPVLAIAGDGTPAPHGDGHVVGVQKPLKETGMDLPRLGRHEKVDGQAQQFGFRIAEQGTGTFVGLENVPPFVRRDDRRVGNGKNLAQGPFARHGMGIEGRHVQTGQGIAVRLLGIVVHRLDANEPSSRFAVEKEGFQDSRPGRREGLIVENLVKNPRVLPKVAARTAKKSLLIAGSPEAQKWLVDVGDRLVPG
ncbi:MAG: hypothetical protein H7841_11785 [Magnetospirillum sp. WYHS-4]